MKVGDKVWVLCEVREIADSEIKVHGVLGGGCFSYKFGGVKHDETKQATDAVNPSHYKQGPAETIDIIEAAIAKAPSNKAAGLHWQVLKYVLRCWFKNGVEDLKKARWYLDRLIKEVGE